MKRQTKRQIAGLLCMALAVSMTGCKGDHTVDQKTDKMTTPVAQISVSRQEVEQALKSCNNMTVGKDLTIRVPSSVKAVYKYTADYSDDMNMKEYEKAFMDLHQYLCPKHTLKDEDLYYIGGSSELKLDDNTGAITQNYKKVKDMRGELYAGQEGSVSYFYDETWNKTVTHWDQPIALQFGNPIGFGYATVNKGKTVKISDYKFYDEDLQMKRYPDADSYEPTDNLKYVTSYSPDSNVKYRLLDGEMSICDAVDFFEQYVNNMPMPYGSNVRTVVTGVDVYQVTKDVYGYQMLTTKEYEGVCFDRTREGQEQGYQDYDDYSPLMGSGFMLECGDVDILHSWYQKEPVKKAKEYDRILSGTDAVKMLSSQLTDNVKFTFQSLELVYTQKYAKTKEGYIDTEHLSADVAPAWKMTVTNENDALTYSCYIDAVDGKHFRYATMPTKWWESENN